MKTLLSFYKRHFSLSGCQFSRIDHNDTIIAVVYRITHPSFSPRILKICPRAEDYHREFFFLKTLTKQLPVPQVLNAVDPSEDTPGALLMECLEGDLSQPKDWTIDLAHEVGSALATLHVNRTHMYGDLTNPQKQTPDVMDYFGSKFYEELEECSSHLSQTILDRCRSEFESHSSSLSSVDGPCLIHRDFRPGNLLISQGKLSGVIDWAGGRSGFAEQDFCGIEHWQWPQNADHKHALLEGYSSIRPVPPYETLMPLLRLGQALAVVGFCVKSGTWKGKNRSLYQYNREFLDRFS